MSALRTRVVRWELAPTGAARGRSTVREAVIVDLSVGDVVGYGEAAPLGEVVPGESLGAALRALEAVPPGLFDDVDDLDEVLARCATCGSPSARFALETAWLDAIAQRRGCSLAGLLGAAARTLPLAAVVDDAAAARAQVAAGVRCLKIKVGAGGELERVREIAAAAPGVALRLDANRSWPRDTVIPRLATLAEAGIPIEYVEEPCRDAHALLATALPVPIALDESLVELARPDLDRALASPHLAALVLKPTLLGGIAACNALARRARVRGIGVVVTHALEGPIGTAACAALALALHDDDRAAGLAAHPGLASWAVTPPAIGAATVGHTSLIGLGLARGALDDALVAVGDPLSIRTAAHTTGGEAAVLGAERRTWLACAAAARSGRRVVVATPTLETLAAIHAALDERRPLALLHPRLPAAALARQTAVVDAAALADDEVVLFTSGSTGAARGVVLGRDALIAAAAASAAHLGWRDDDRWLLALPLAHAGGLAVAVRCLAARRAIVLVEDARALAPRLAACTIASLVPTQLALLLDDPAWRPPRQLRLVLLGGAAAAPSLLVAAAARGVPFLATYGMTETFGQVATAVPDHAGDPDAPLVALPGITITAGTSDLPARIRVAGPVLARRYLDGAPIAPELATADLGTFEHGVLRVVGRADDVIISGGENIHPQVIEAVLAATPGVRAACAFGIADDRWGQRVGAALAVDPSFELATAVAAWREELPSHARPRELAVVHALPTSPNGKLDRRAAAQIPRIPTG